MIDADKYNCAGVVHRSAKVNAAAFERATEEIAAAARVLLASLVTGAEPRTRELEALKAKTRSAQRFAVRE